MSGKIEKRKHTRIEFKKTVEVRCKGIEPLTLEIEDLSFNGVRVRAPSKNIPKGECELILNLSGTSSELTIKVRGQAIREGSGSLVFGFTSADPDSYLHLRNIILYNAIDTEKIEDEFKKHPSLKGAGID